MGKIFIVTDGAYSGYHIVGVFSSREKAEEFAPAAVADIGYATIEEWELDVMPDEGYLQQIFTTRLDPGGNVIYESDPLSPETEQRPRDWSESYVWKDSPPYSGQVRGRSVISQEHARKIAVDARQAFLREQAIHSVAGTAHNKP